MIEGTAEIWLGKESAIVKPNQSVLVPAGARHGFRNLENTTLHPMAAGPKRQSGGKTARHADCLFSRLYSRFRAGLG
jgi:mannose-6-phosphate isomerase-like protein (cupin superfamily)